MNLEYVLNRSLQDLLVDWILGIREIIELDFQVFGFVLL